MFKSRNIIFEEGITYIAKQSTPIIFSEDNNHFQLILAQDLGINKDKQPKPKILTHDVGGVETKDFMWDTNLC